MQVVNFNYGKKDKNPIDHVCFYTKKDPNKEDKRKRSEVGVRYLLQISSILTSIDSLFLLYLLQQWFIIKVSGLLPKKFEEQEIRFYCKKDDDTSLKEASIAFQDFKDLYCP